MVRNESFSPRDICISARLDKYNTINRSCSGGEGEEGGKKGEKAVGGKERERGVPIWSERYACYLVPSTLSI